MGSIFDLFAGKHVPHFGDPFGTPNLKSHKQNTHKQCPESSVEQVCSQSSPETANIGFCIGITKCFERTDIIHLGGFWSPFGSLLGSLFYNSSKKLRFGSSETSVNKQASTNNESKHPGSYEMLAVNP